VSLARYASIVGAVVGGSLAALWPLLERAPLPRTQWAALFGGALAAANTLAAYGLVLWSARRSTQTFLGAVLGGMVGRMALMLGAVVAAVLGLGLPKVPLAISLLSYFVVFLVFEIAVLHKRVAATSGTP
jgi:hypothetical protein